jgi:hypothetical protein
MQLFETRTVAVLSKAEQVLPLRQATVMADGSPAADDGGVVAMDSPRGGPDGRTPLMLGTPEARLRRLLQMQCVNVARDAQTSMAALRQALTTALTQRAAEVSRAAAEVTAALTQASRATAAAQAVASSSGAQADNSAHIHPDPALRSPPLGPASPQSPTMTSPGLSFEAGAVDDGSPFEATASARLISALKQERRTARHSYAAAQRLGLEVVRLRERLQVAEVELAAVRGRHQQDAAAAREREERLALALRTATQTQKRAAPPPPPPPPPPAPAPAPVPQQQQRHYRPPVSDSSELSDSDTALPAPLAHHRRQKRQAVARAAGSISGRIPAFRAGSFYNDLGGSRPTGHYSGGFDETLL